LLDLGEYVHLFDIDPGRTQDCIRDYGWYDSILICTPPETHYKLITELGRYKVPLFCEKPIICEPGAYKWPDVPSLVGCNYRFNDDYTTGYSQTYTNMYKNTSKYAYLDLIHFIDLWWEKWGKPSQYKLSVFGPYIDFWGRFGSFQKWEMAVQLTVNSKVNQAFVADCGSNVLRNERNMTICFYKQMVHWLQVVKGKEKSVNPFKKAYKRTEWLINARNTNNGLEAGAWDAEAVTEQLSPRKA